MGRCAVAASGATPAVPGRRLTDAPGRRGRPHRGGRRMPHARALSYEVVEGWEQLPRGYAHRDVAGVAVDSEDRVFLLCRGDHPVLVYDRAGRFLRSWGEGAFTYRTHGITIGPDDMV